MTLFCPNSRCYLILGARANIFSDIYIYIFGLLSLAAVTQNISIRPQMLHWHSESKFLVCSVADIRLGSYPICVRTALYRPSEALLPRPSDSNAWSGRERGVGESRVAPDEPE